MLIHQIGADGSWTGESQEIEDRDPCPQGWTRAELPTLGDGERAVIGAEGWEVAPIVSVSGGAGPQPESPTLNKIQVLLGLKAAGKLGAFNDLLVAIRAADPMNDALLRWEGAQTIARDNPSTVAFATQLGIDAAGLDELFVTSALLA